MEKIDRYVDEVCRGIGGSRAMRAHVRQELREHLFDAVAAWRAGGMSETEAVDKALADFGGSGEVRGALEEAHGHRLTAVVVEKILQWKEHTMHAKWLWMTLTHVAFGLLILLETLFIYGVAILCWPMFRANYASGYFKSRGESEGIYVFLSRIIDWCYDPWLILLVIASLWAYFELRVRSEHKSWMRLSFLGFLALSLFVLAAIMASLFILIPLMTLPAAVKSI